MTKDPGGRPRGGAYLLTQLGTFAAGRFAGRMAELGLAPPDAGVLRILSRSPGMSQRELATTLGAAPSRVVALIDGLQERGLVERRRSTSDRRNHELTLTDRGTDTLARIGTIARAHEDDILAPLGEDRSELVAMLARLAAAHGLEPDVHPGYRTLPPAR